MHKRWFFMGAMLSMSAIGCSGDPAAREPIGPADAHAVSHNLLSALNQGNYVEFRRDFRPELAEIFDEQAFVRLQSRLSGVCGDWISVEAPWQTSSVPPELRFETDAEFASEDVHVWLWFEGDDPRLRGFWMDSPGLQSAP
jgi:hypothetical protein